ncbi:MAG: hypothetical protein KDM63_17950 [Verrucomicrobiae bacterium]|nr:hypothetical protein [Verrucomicrobiae bacterium]
MASCREEDGARPAAILTLPCLDFASIIVASGIVVERFRNFAPVEDVLESWKTRKGEDVSFAYKRTGAVELRRLKGRVSESDVHMGRERLLIRFLEAGGNETSRAIDPRWMGLTKPLEEAPCLDNLKGGSLLATDVESLDSIIGQSGILELLSVPHRTCCIIDTKNRVREETKSRILLDRLGYSQAGKELVLRDVVRLASEGPEAMAETYCCEVRGDPGTEWPATIMAGSLRFIKSWEDCDSEVRIAILSPTENSYRDAVDLANNMYAQRSEDELTPPAELLSMKPAVIDLQMMYTD